MTSCKNSNMEDDLVSATRPSDMPEETNLKQKKVLLILACSRKQHAYIEAYASKGRKL